jgi:hypothetical protein
MSNIKGFDCPQMGQVSFEECLAHARACGGIPPCGFGLPTLAAMQANLTGHDSALDELAAAYPYVFRVTSLSGPCPRETVLEHYYPPEYARPQSTYWTTRGAFMHLAKAEYAPVGAISEQRLALELTIPGLPNQDEPVKVIVTGKFDSLYLFEEEATVSHTLIDYKSTAALAYLPKPEHIGQLNSYNLLLEVNRLPRADRLAIDYFSMQAEQVIEVEVWESERTIAYLEERIRPRLAALLAGPQAEEQAEADRDAWLPPRLDPKDRKNGGWKCHRDYCRYADFCWPKGIGNRPGR